MSGDYYLLVRALLLGDFLMLFRSSNLADYEKSDT